MTNALKDLAVAQKKLTLSDYEKTRPIITEVEAIRRAIFFAKQTGISLHICHVNSSAGIAEVVEAQAKGFDITAETCTHYLALSLKELDECDNLAKCSPPIQPMAEQNMLWKCILNNALLCVASNHSPCTPDMKEGDIFRFGVASRDFSIALKFSLMKLST